MQETQECLLCLRIPLEKIRNSVENLLPHVDDAVVDRVAERAAKLISTAYEKDRFALCGKSPTCLMGAAIYLSGQMDKDVIIGQEKTAEELEVTAPSIRIRAKHMSLLLGLGFDKFRNTSRCHYVCPFCEEAFLTLSSLKKHLKCNEIKYSFSLRTKMFNNKGILVDKKMLQKLKRRDDTLAKRAEWLESYLCPFCDKKFVYLGLLSSHLEYNGVKTSHAHALRIRMFNENGILLDEEILEKMKKNHIAPCEEEKWGLW